MNSFLEESEESALRSSDLATNTPYVMRGVSRTQLSIARHYGGCTFQGKQYTYMDATDELIRDDVLQWLTKRRKASAKVGKSVPKTSTRVLPGMEETT